MRVSKMIQAVDTHACGEPARVIVGGVLDVPGATMFEKMVYLERPASTGRFSYTPSLIRTTTGTSRNA